MDIRGKASVICAVVLLGITIQTHGYWLIPYAQVVQDGDGYNYEVPMVQFELPKPMVTPMPVEPSSTVPPAPTVFPPRTSICVLVTAEGVKQDISGGVFVTQEIKGGPVVFSGTIQGLLPGLHGFHLHRDASEGSNCAAAGPHFNPFNSTHGGPMDTNRHAGDFGNIEVNELGVAFVNIVSPGEMLAVERGGSLGVIGRSLVIHEKPDDLGRGGNEESLKTGNAGARSACCVIMNLPNSPVPPSTP